MVQHKDKPEGVQVTIEILQNLPREKLQEISAKASTYREEDVVEIWDEIIEKWYDK